MTQKLAACTLENEDGFRKIECDRVGGVIRFSYYERDADGDGGWGWTRTESLNPMGANKKIKELRASGWEMTLWR